MVRPFFNVPVVLVEDEHRSERQMGKVERHPYVDKVCGCSVFFGRPEQEL